MPLLETPAILPLGDSAVVVSFGDGISLDIHHVVMALTRYLEEYPQHGFIEWIPAYATVTIFYDPLRIQYEELHFQVESIVKGLKRFQPQPPRKVEIPVCYGGEFGPDLAFVAEHNGLAEHEVIKMHSQAEYTVYMIGFAPGFPYLGGLSEQIAAPRLTHPRTSITTGSVGIAGKQTGVYPISTPGGWRLIGKTPLALFKPEWDPPSLLRAGDIVNFRPIGREEYEHLNRVEKEVTS